MTYKTPLTPEQRQLVEDHMYLVTVLVGKYGEEVYDSVIDGLMNASKRFDPAFGMAFGAYAHFRMVGYVKDAFRAKSERKKFQRQAFHQWGENEEDGGSFSFPDRRAVNPLEELLAKETADTLLRLVPPRFKCIAAELAKGHTLKEISIQVGVSESYIGQLVQRMRRSLATQGVCA